VRGTLPDQTPEGFQVDGVGSVYLVLAHTDNGDHIPGKGVKGESSVHFGNNGKEHTSSDFSWVQVPGHSIVPNQGTIPADSLAFTSPSGKDLYGVITHSQFGNIPGISLGTDFATFSYGGSEHKTQIFSWIVCGVVECEDSSSDEETVFRSGDWHGYYVQGGQQGDMDFKLTFSDGKISGGGVDSIGDFSFHGTYDSNIKTVHIIKAYSTHQVVYQGGKTAQGTLEGSWRVGDAHGTFLLKKGKRKN